MKIRSIAAADTAKCREYKETFRACPGGLPGSYTVEASILVSMILLIMMAWFFLAFTFHDRMVARALALFYTEAAGRMMEEPVSDDGRLLIERLNERSGFLTGSYGARIVPSVFEERFRTAADGLLLISRPETVRLQVEGREARLTFSSAARYPASVPGFSFMYDNNGSQKESRYGLSVPPETVIRAARGLLWKE